jgi:adenosylhomocysteine nucleosidase
VLLVVTPTSREFAALLASIEDLAPSAIGRLEGAATARRDLVVVPGGLGKAQFAVHTQHALEVIGAAPALVICAGTSGALDRTLGIGDVVAGTHTVEHDFKAGVPSPEFEGHAPTLDRLRADEVLRALDFALHFGRIASGDEGIESHKRADALRAATEALVVAWEGAGGARAAGFAGAPYLELRAVSDHAGPGAIDDYRANTPLAMANIAHVIERLRALAS